MYRKLPFKILVLCIVFAVLMISISTLIYYRGKIVKCNKFGGVIMKDQNGAVISTDYEEIVSDLNNKYFLKTCDIFDEARRELLSKFEAILGDEYILLNNEIKSLKAEMLARRQKFDSENESLALKDKLAQAKESLDMANSDEEKTRAKSQINEVLALITKRNLANFASLGQLKKQIDDKCLKALEIVNSKEAEFKDVETKIVNEAKNKSLELAVSYKGELDALSKIFDVTNEDNSLPFLKPFDPNMRLIDFDKESFIAKQHAGSYGCGDSCGGDCSACAAKFELKKAEKNFYKSEADKKFKD